MTRQALERAEWLLGLYHLAKGDLDAARQAFEQAITAYGLDNSRQWDLPTRLQNFVARGIQAEAAAELLHTYWGSDAPEP